MAPPRIQIAGATYHVNSKSVDGTPLFADESDRLLFLRLVRSQAQKSRWCILAYSLMTTHFHLLLRLDEETLSSGFQRLKSVYARLYNRRHGRRGALWQRRYFDVMIETEPHLYEVIRYIAWNAPRAGLCEVPEAWPWCGYGAAVGARLHDPLVNEDELLNLFGPRPEEAREWLRNFVELADPRVLLSQTRV